MKKIAHIGLGIVKLLGLIVLVMKSMAFLCCF